MVSTPAEAPTTGPGVPCASTSSAAQSRARASASSQAHWSRLLDAMDCANEGPSGMSRVDMSSTSVDPESVADVLASGRLSKPSAMRVEPAVSENGGYPVKSPILCQKGHQIGDN